MGGGGGGGGGSAPGPYRRKKSTKIFLAVLRILTALATGIASLTMYLNEKNAKISDYPAEVIYKSSPSFRFFIFANAAVCGYILVTLPCAILSNWINCLVQIVDMLALGVMAAAGAAVTAISYLGARQGNDRAGWLPICARQGNFCYRVAISLLCSFSGLGLLYLICVISFITCTKIAIKTTIIHN